MTWEETFTALAFVVLLGVLGGIGLFAAPAAAAGQAGMAGNGTVDDPYEITNATQLQAMAEELDAHYVLGADVDASGFGEFTPVGVESDSGFGGTLDGNGYAIEGLTTNTSRNRAGVFATIASGGTVSNVAVRNVTADGAGYVGAIAGSSSGTIRNVVVSGEVNNGDTRGGIVGNNHGTIEASISTVKVAGSGEYVGGAVGNSHGSEQDVYWNTHESGQSTSDGDATGLATDAMTGWNATERMSGLNYSAAWAVTDDYPVLRSPGATGDPYVTFDVTDHDDSVVAGETASVTVETTNIGLGTATRTTELTADGEQQDSDEVVLDGGKSTLVSLEWNTTGAAVDTYSATVSVEDDSQAVDITVDRPATFEIRELNGPETADAGDAITVDATIENVGDVAGTANVSLNAGGIDEVATATADVSGGDTEHVTLEYDVPVDAETGSLTLEAQTQDDASTASLHVNGNETLTGTVTDGATGDPLSSVTVTVDGGDRTQTAETDENGTYSVTVLNASGVTVSATTTIHGTQNSLEITATNATTVDGATTLDLALHPELPGSGTENDPYEISNARELQAMSQDLSAHYVLVENVGASGTAAWNDGRGFDPIGEFDDGVTGTFDGDGHGIRNLTVNRDTAANVGGVFGWVDGGVITNVSLVDVDIDGGDATGGIIGGGTDGEISEVAVSGDVTGNTSGGIVGESGVAVSDAYVTANVTGETSTGGIVGIQRQSGSVTAAYAVGEIDGNETSRTGGVIGHRQGGSVDNAYWDEAVTGADRGVGANDGSGETTGLTTTEMTGVNATENMALAFDSTWIALDGDYPVLSHQIASYDSSLANDEFAVDGGSTDATVDVTLRDGTTATATNTSTYATGGNVSVDDGGTVTADTYGTGTVTASAGGYSDAVTVTALDADYEVTITDAPSTVTAGESYRITVSVRNVGNENGSGTVSIEFGNETIHTESVELDQGATDSPAIEYGVPATLPTGTIVLNATTPEDGTTRTVHVNGNETLTGTVTDGVTGTALSGVTVSVDDGESNRTIDTDGAGRFTIDVRNASEVSVFANSTIDRKNGDVALSGANDTTIDGATTLDLALFQTLPGNGTTNDPYRIDTPAELQTIEQDLAANYALVDDVNASETVDWNGGKGFEPIGDASEGFTGTLDGDGHAVAGLTIERPNESQVGLFGRAFDARIGDVRLTEVTTLGGDGTGGLVGTLATGSAIANASVTGTVTGNDDVGAIAGDSWGNLTALRAAGTVEGTSDVGGLVGFNGGRVDSSYATVTVEGTRDVGGLMGYNQGTLSASYATGTISISGEGFGGGLVGSNGAGSATDVYWEDANATDDAFQPIGSDPRRNGIELDADEMRGPGAAAAMDGFAFGSTWTLTDGYPRLMWEVTSVDLSVADTTMRVGATTNATVTLDLASGAVVSASTVADYASSSRAFVTVDGRVLVATGTGTAAVTASHASRLDWVAVEVAAPSDGGGSDWDDSGGSSANDGGDADTGDRNATISVANVSLGPDAVEAGETVRVTVTLENAGDADGTREVSLAVDDETVVSTTAFVPAGGAQTVAVTERFDAAGTYTLEVAGTDRQLVVGESTPVPDDENETNPTDTDDTASNSGGGGLPIGSLLVGGSLVVIGAAASLLWRREH